jgi:hypothetical protein
MLLLQTDFVHVNYGKEEAQRAVNLLRNEAKNFACRALIQIEPSNAGHCLRAQQWVLGDHLICLERREG